MALSNKQQAFVSHYLTTWNATEAARRAGYRGSDAALATIGHRHVRNVEISEAIKQRLQETAMTADEVLMRLASHARGDISDFLDDNGYFDLTKAREAQKTSLIKKLKTKTTTRVIDEMEVTTTEVEFELYDAQAANRLIGDHFGLFKGNQSDAATNDDTLWDEAAEDGQAAAVPPSTA